MRRPKFRLALCAAGLAAALAGGALALGNGDSLISLSYLTDTFLPSAQSQLEEIQNDAMQEAYDQAAAQIQSGAGTGSGLYSADFQSRTLSQGDIITLPTGSGLMIYGGTGELAHNGAVIDVTDGTAVPSGTRLTAGHRYLVGEDTSAALAVRSGVMYLGLQGSYTFTDSGTQSLPFVDVARGDWYESAVEYAYTNGLFSGTSADAFSPNLTMNRAMLVTVLYRLAGSPEEELNSAQASFWDVAADSWYAPYVRWGYVQGVTAGTGEGSFGPEQSITRQQLLVMLHSFARQYLGLTLTSGADLSQYSDGGQTASWAQEAVSWAAANQLIVPSGDGTIRPEDPASRAEVATILMKFDSLYL